MKISNILLTSAAAIAFVGIAIAPHAEEVMTTEEHLQEFQKGSPAVYGKSHATDIGNVVHHGDVSTTSEGISDGKASSENKKHEKTHHKTDAKPAEK